MEEKLIAVHSMQEKLIAVHSMEETAGMEETLQTVTLSGIIGLLIIPEAKKMLLLPSS